MFNDEVLELFVLSERITTILSAVHDLVNDPTCTRERVAKSLLTLAAEMSESESSMLARINTSSK